MKQRSNTFLLAGLLLVLVSFGLLAVTILRTNAAASTAAELAAELEKTMPPRSVGLMDSYTNMEMPAFSLDGQDFIGTVTIPAFQTVLPIASVWDAGTVSSFPCRFWGTVYDGSLVLGGADQKGQFDFLEQIQNGDSVLVTDMTGAQFSYRVSAIHRADSARADILLDGQSDLTIFARNARSLEYIIVRCVMG